MKMIDKLIGIMSIILGIKVLFIHQWQGRWTYYEFSQNYFFLILGILLLIFGSIWLYSLYKYPKNTKKIDFSKCPKCKESYSYDDLKDGYCPSCHIKAIDLKEYFKKYPDEHSDHQVT